MNDNYIVSSAPHMRDKINTSRIMLDVIIALLPTIGTGIWFFGYRAGLIVFISVVSAMLFEFLFNKFLNRKSTIWDLSAIVSGIILSLNLPVTVPLWLPVVGSFFMIIIVKMLFGGLGQNFINPAAAARAFLVISWPSLMSVWVFPFTKLDILTNPDVISVATPLAIVKDNLASASVKIPTYLDLYFGNVAGCIGEVSAFALLLGGLYLLYRRVIDWRAPLTYISTVFILSACFGGDPVYHVLSGGLLLGAIFMATDYPTSPITPVGRLFFGVGLGVLTILFRFAGKGAEGVCYAILLMNVIAPLIDKLTAPRRFGMR